MNAIRIVFITTILVGTMGLIQGASAAEEQPSTPTTICPVCRQANNTQAPYAEKAGSTLVRGAMNAAFGWTEMLVQPTEELNRGGNLATGIGKGLGQAVKRTALGFGELLTFWTPKGKEGNIVLTRDCPICFSTSTAAANPPKSSSAPPPKNPPLH